MKENLTKFNHKYVNLTVAKDLRYIKIDLDYLFIPPRKV